MYVVGEDMWRSFVATTCMWLQNMAIFGADCEKTPSSTRKMETQIAYMKQFVGIQAMEQGHGVCSMFVWYL